MALPHIDIDGEIKNCAGAVQRKVQNYAQIGNRHQYHINGEPGVKDQTLYRHFEETAIHQDPNMTNLWTGFERFLTSQFPDAEQIAITYADPGIKQINTSSFLPNLAIDTANRESAMEQTN